jgi:hypothetical protein
MPWIFQTTQAQPVVQYVDLFVETRAPLPTGGEATCISKPLTGHEIEKRADDVTYYW